MSRLNDLLRQLEVINKDLARDLRQEYDALADRRAFGLNFERHTPEVVELPGRRIRTGDKVHVLPERGTNPTAENSRLWRVLSIDRAAGMAALEDSSVEPVGTTEVAIVDLVVAAEFRDPIYPGLVSTGKVERGGDKPFHTVINAENYHALQTLLFTHRGQVDCIYIDPPYNTGNEGWIYSDTYVAGDDHYKHSKWLAFMERRLRLAKELLSESGFILVSIDDREQARLKMLLDQIFSASNFVSTFAWRSEGHLDNQARIKIQHEYIHMYARDTAYVHIEGVKDPNIRESSKLNNAEVRNSVVKNGPKNPPSTIVLPAGFPAGFSDGMISMRDNKFPVYEVDLVIRNGRLVEAVEATTGWANASLLKKYIEGGFREIVDTKGQPTRFELTHTGAIDNVKTRRADQHHILSVLTDMSTVEVAGNELRRMGVHFPYPKPLPLISYLSSFAPRDGIILDFFGGSGTTAEAVMRLNDADAGTRRCVLVTNNEAAASDARKLRKEGHRPGDPEWEAIGVFEYVAKPRIETVATGVRPDGSTYSEGLDQNVEFFALTYESPLRVSSDREFAKIAPLLWLRAGSRGRRIDGLSAGWDVAEAYGVLKDLDQTEPFLKAVAEAGEDLGIVYVVTDEDRLFQSVVRELPGHVEGIRLYEAYLRNFEIESGRGNQ